MKLLLDENLPRKLKFRFIEAGHQTFTVPEMGWASKQNGELLQLMLAAGFECLITRDSSLAYQQNFAQYPIPVMIIKAKSGQYVDMIPFIPEMLILLDLKLQPGPHRLDYQALGR